MLDLAGDPIALTAALVDVESVSGDEAAAGRPGPRGARPRSPHLTVIRDGNNVLARTDGGKEQRVLLAGHLDTVPTADNVPSHREGDFLFGCGTSDMKSGDAVLLHLAATVTDPAYDVTFVLYDNEEVAAEKNGLNRITCRPPRLARRRPRDPDGADQRQRRGRLPGDAAGRCRAHRQARAQRPQLARRRTRSMPRRRCWRR